MSQLSLTTHKAPKKVNKQIHKQKRNLFEKDKIICKYKNQHSMDSIKDCNQNKDGLCKICGQLIPVERRVRYPEVTTCVPCQNLLDSPVRLRMEITQLHNNLVLMKKQLGASEKQELLSPAKLEVWQKDIRLNQERLCKLQSALYDLAVKPCK